MFLFGKNKQRKMDRDLGKKTYDALTSTIQSDMAAVLIVYLDALLDRLNEAGDDPQKISILWEEFKIALAPLPDIFEEAFRERYSNVFEVLKEAKVNYIVSGLIKQEFYDYARTLPAELERGWLIKELEQLRSKHGS